MTDHSAATLAQVGFQGVISYDKLQAASKNGTALVTVAQALGGGFWAKVMALFLGWIFVKSVGSAPWTQRWSLIGIVAAGLILMFSARFILRSTFFQIARESEEVKGHRKTRWR